MCDFPTSPQRKLIMIIVEEQHRWASICYTINNLECLIKNTIIYSSKSIEPPGVSMNSVYNL